MCQSYSVALEREGKKSCANTNKERLETPRCDTDHHDLTSCKYGVKLHNKQRQWICYTNALIIKMYNGNTLER